MTSLLLFRLLGPIFSYSLFAPVSSSGLWILSAVRADLPLWFEYYLFYFVYQIFFFSFSLITGWVSPTCGFSPTKTILFHRYQGSFVFAVTNMVLLPSSQSPTSMTLYIFLGFLFLNCMTSIHNVFAFVWTLYANYCFFVFKLCCKLSYEQLSLGSIPYMFSFSLLNRTQLLLMFFSIFFKFWIDQAGWLYTTLFPQVWKIRDIFYLPGFQIIKSSMFPPDLHAKVFPLFRFAYHILNISLF